MRLTDPQQSHISYSRASALLGSVATLSLLMATPSFAQVSITDDLTAPIDTATADEGNPSDVVIESGASVVLTDDEGPAVTVNSDNSLTNEGAISISDVDNATAVSLEGGADREFINAGSIVVDEDFTAANTDDDPFTDTPFAEGTGRRGILISGASPFEGNVTLEQASTILVEGNESFGVDLSNTAVGAGLDGTLTNSGAITLRGDNGAAVRLASDVTGNVINNGTISVSGEGSAAFDIGADIGGGFRSTGAISNNGFRFTDRPTFNPDFTFDRTDLGEEDLRQAGSAVQFNGNIDQGIAFTRRTEVITDAEGNPVLDADGNETTRTVSISSLSQFGSAPAILIDGDGTPIAIGRVGAITDPADPDYDEDLLYGFINDGTLQSSGVYNDFDATTLSVSDATLEGGISNTGTLSVNTFVGGTERDIENVELGTGLAQVIVLGDNAIAERINNTGIIIASVSEAIDEVYFDPENILPPRALTATTINIGENASLNELTNNGVISAILVGRNGTATVVSDASGSLSDIVNRGIIQASGVNSDSEGNEETDFSLIAFDLSANTSGVSILQEQLPDEDPDDDISPREPSISGDIRLGSGDDSIVSTAGTITGDVDFGAGNDVLSLASSRFDGDITNVDGLDISVLNQSTLTLRGSEPVAISSAEFDETSTFSPTIDGTAGTATTLQASGSISFASGAAINPIFRDLISTATQMGSVEFDVANADTLTVADLESLNMADSGSFLFNTTYSLADANTLVVTVDMRDTEQLGLDQTQAGVEDSVFGATIQALQSNSDLANEVSNLGTASEFYAAYNQLLPEFAAASRVFVQANSDGAIGAVGNHLDSARRSPDRPGGAWIQEFAYFADRDLAGLSEQYRGEGFGFAAGLDTAWGPFHAVGVNVGYVSTEVEDVIGVDEPLDVSSFIAGLYAGYARGALGVDFYGGVGFNEFEQNRRVIVGDFTGRANGEWDGINLSGSIRAGYDIALSERFWIRPTLSLDYLRLEEDAYTETGDLGVALDVDSRTSEVGTISALMNFGAKFEGERTWIRPSLRVGYRNDFLSDPVFTSYRFAGIENSLLAQTDSSQFPESGVVLGFSVAAGSGYSSVGFDFDSDIRDGFIRHTGRIVVRLLF